MRQYTAASCVYLFVIVMTYCDRNDAAAPTTKFTNLQCEINDPDYATFQQCRLKMIKRGVPGLNLYIKLFKLPVTNVMANMAFYKKANGFKPFLYNFTVEYCDFAKKAKSNILLKIIMNFITPYSNINHSCPYNHDIIIKNLIMPEEKFRLLPLPSGEYMLKFMLSTNKDLELTVKAYFLRTE